MEWIQFLSGVPAKDYVFQKEPYEEQINRAAEYINEAEVVLIGAGSGLSAAAGLTYSGERFQENFKEFIKKYGVKDMYSAGFYPFPSEEERWGYWSKHVDMNRITPPALPLFQKLFGLVKAKIYFVITTNVDHQFHKAGFDETKIFATQGDYGYIQCARACHKKTYNALKLFDQMNRIRKDCKVPSYIVPKCPVCGGSMAMHLRCDQYFVEDESWHKSADAYGKFLSAHLKGKKVVLLELGVGFNTPTIIRFPFEKMIHDYCNLTMIRLNLDEAFVPESFEKRIVGINDDIVKSLSSISKAVEQKRGDCSYDTR